MQVQFEKCTRRRWRKQGSGGVESGVMRYQVQCEGEDAKVNVDVGTEAGPLGDGQGASSTVYAVKSSHGKVSMLVLSTVF